MAQVLAVAGATGTLGRSVVTAARDAGHEVRRIARSTGVDLLTGDGLPEALRGADAIIDCSKPPTLEEQEATRWFTTAMRTLGAAAESAGIRRTVVISIVGIDRMQDYGFYRAQLVHEDAARAHCPGPAVVRATQFHDFVGTMLQRDGERFTVIDVASQPVDTRVVARELLRQATATRPEPLTQIAGPRAENTLDQARRLLAARGDDTPVVGIPASPSMRKGLMLPDPDVPTAGPTYDEWLQENVSREGRDRDG